MTLDALRIALADALGGADGSPAVLTDYPEGTEYLAAAPFAVLGFRSFELASLGFGDPTPRRGSFAFSLDVYARSGGDAATALALLAAAAQTDGVRALLDGVKLSADGTKPDRDGLTVTGAVLSGEAPVALGAAEDAGIIDLHFSANLVGI